LDRRGETRNTAISSIGSSKASTPSKNATTDDVAAGRRVLEHAKAGLQALSDGLGADFVAAVGIFSAVTGRVVVSGVGKSGHVGRKIAATLASTGTPAFFVHAGEASHGDLGMVAKGDAILAISNSGEVVELHDIIAYAKRFDIPLVAITSKPSSTLAQAASVTLLLPPVSEACTITSAPTTSTTMTLALGDALAVALLERRGFTADDYRVFHPGGQLGRKLLKVRELMHAGDEVPLVSPTTPMSDVVLVMTKKTFGVAGVVDAGGDLIGIVTDGDLRRRLTDIFKLTAGEVMTKDPKTTPPSAFAAEAMRRMNEWKITSVFVVDDGKPVGILRMHDILRAGAV